MAGKMTVIPPKKCLVAERKKVAAYESDFPNYKYYQSLFKKYYGVTPKKYLSDLNK